MTDIDPRIAELEGLLGIARPKQGELAGAVAACIGEIGVVKKTGRNTHFDYTFASDADITAAVGPAMARHGLALLPVGVDPIEGATPHEFAAFFRYELAHESGESREVLALGFGLDKQDKALSKASTMARKYALLGVFAVASADDPDKFAGPSKPEHDEGFTERARKRFAADIGDLRPGLTYGQLAGYLESIGKPRPSALSTKQRADLVKWLRAGAADRVFDWAAAEGPGDDDGAPR